MIVDIIVGVVVLLSAIIAFLRGFIREVLTIAGVVGGLLAAVFLGPKLAPLFRDWFGVEEGDDKPAKLFDIIPVDIAADVTAYAMVFVIVVIAISVLSHFISGAVKAMGLGPIDRTLGVLFGVARGIVLLGLFYLPFHLMMNKDTKQDLFKDSRTHYFIEDVSEALVGFLPDSGEVGDAAQKKGDEFKDRLLKQNLLPADDKNKAKPAESKAEPEKTPAQQNGYDKTERTEIDRLFDEQPGYNE